MANAVAKQGETVALTPLMMLDNALQRGTDIDQLTKLMDLQERWEKNEAQKAFQQAMGKFKQNPPTIAKNKKVNAGPAKWEYADLAEVCSKVIAGLNEVSITHRWETSQTPEGAVIVTCVLTHEQGHSETNTMQAQPDTSGSKNAIQAIASANTYLQRYTLLGACGLAVEGQDDDGQNAAPMKVPAPKGTSDQFENKDGTLAISNLKKAVRDLVEDVNACQDSDSLVALLNTGTAQEVMSLTEKFLGPWWYGNADSRGLKGTIDDKRGEFSE